MYIEKVQPDKVHLDLEFDNTELAHLQEAISIIDAILKETDGYMIETINGKGEKTIISEHSLSIAKTALNNIKEIGENPYLDVYVYVN